MLHALFKMLRSLLVAEDGPTAVEYAVIVMLIFLAVLSTVQLLGLTLSASFQESGDQIHNALFGNQ